MELLAGAASVDITPDGPQWLDGYGNRSAPAAGAYQAITARALALGSGRAETLLLSAEVLGFDRERVPALKERIARRTGVPAAAVVLAATHTHCAPRVCDMVMPGEVDPAYVETFESRCVEAAAAACARLAPARLQLSRAPERLGVNRRLLTEQGCVMRPNPEGRRDAEIDTLWIEARESGAVVASVTIAACHPTCRGGPEIGGDYPGFLWRELEGALGGVALFVLGCAGDVRPHFVSETGGFRMAEPDEVEEAGRRMARDVLAGRAERVEVPVRALRARRRVAEAPLAEPPGEAELRETAAADPSPLRREWARRLLERGPAALPRSVPFEIQVLRLEPGLTLIFWPGEVVADYALWLKSLAPAGERFMVGAYANGAVGYVPSASIYPYGGYEVDGSHPYYNLPAPYAPGIELVIREETRDILKEAFDGETAGAVH